MPLSGIVDVTNDSEEDVTAIVDVIADSDEGVVKIRSGAPPLRFRGYRRGRELGRGASGKVFVCHRKGHGSGFAVKAVDLRRIQLSSNAEREQTALCREVEILKTLPPHPNIVQMVDAFEEGDWLLMILELVGGGDLYTVLTAREQPRLMSREAAFVLRQLACGLTFLHGQGVIHRDLKLENVLIASECRERDMVLYSVKITDFGLSKAIGAGISEAYSLVGTRPYTAPEVLSGAAYDFSSDLWCLGVVTYILLAGRFPFNETPDKQTDVDKIIENFNVSEVPKSVVSGLLQLEPTSRLSLDVLCSHQWLQDEAGAEPEGPPAKRPRLAPPPPIRPAGPENLAEAAADYEKEAAEPMVAAPEDLLRAVLPGPPRAPPDAPAQDTAAALSTVSPPRGARAAATVEPSDVCPASPKPDVMQVHMVVPDRLAEAIHGKAGVQMRQIAGTLGCQVRTTARDRISNHRMIIIGNYTQCAIVQELVRGRLADALRAEGRELADRAEVILFVRAEAAGVVTGKQQFKLKQIRKESGAEIHLQPETVKGQRPCILVGPFSSILRAQRHVFDLVRAVPVISPAEGGPDLPRSRVSTEPILGTVVSWKGQVGWIQPQDAIDHPQAKEHRGHLYIHQKDAIHGASLSPGQHVSFHVYSDFLGLGAEECFAIC